MEDRDNRKHQLIAEIKELTSMPKLTVPQSWLFFKGKPIKPNYPMTITGGYVISMIDRLPEEVFAFTFKNMGIQITTYFHDRDLLNTTGQYSPLEFQHFIANSIKQLDNLIDTIADARAQAGDYYDDDGKLEQ